MPLGKLDLEYPGPVRLRVSVTPELAELIDFLAWVQIDTAQGVIRRGLAEWVKAALETYAYLENMTVDQYLELNLRRRGSTPAPRFDGDRRR